MGQSRLTGLTLLHIHRQITLNVDKIIDRLAKNKRWKDFFVQFKKNIRLYHGTIMICF